MNVFRNKKKGKEEPESARPSMESESSGPFRMFGKKKGQIEDIKPDLDLSTALPSTNDFRTSLLMTGLSARFSMLREQDDPTTKMGKASDDSVLFPRGMSNFGGGLQDIAEVESIRTPSISRLDSFNIDDTSSINGSVMNRAKPVDGNTLFGGRQKVYRLPANSSGVGKDGNMSTRTLYDDDVGMSAFQKWRLAEKEKQVVEEGESNDATDLEPQSESQLESLQESLQESQFQSELLSEPQSEASRRRETSSTVSSVAARYSTATSVTSQGAPSVKDSQITPSTSSSSVERSVLRTKRLYEQGLSRELHEQQSSAMSRMDNLSKGRPFGSTTPDVASPTVSAFSDRILERRPILAKASAPNLRSFTPPVASSASASPAETSSRFPGAPSPKPNFGVPPISPPMSEAEDHPMLPIQPNDRGKATAMGVFDRPAERYDDSTYAQRQLQLQQGRETPVKNHRSMESSTSATSDARSSSSAAVPRQPLEKAETAGVKNAAEDPSSFFDDSDDSSVLSGLLTSGNPPRLSVERPNDGDHPAFKRSAVPAPLSLAPRAASGGLSSTSSPIPGPPQDSPTLGPNSGLSGMVRAHLRSDSNASSIYGMLIQDSEQSVEQSVAQSGLGIDRSPGSAKQTTNVRPMMSRSPSRPRVSNDEAEREEDEFARHLADGARRVREKLGSMVEVEMDRPSPTTAPSLESLRDVNPPRPNALGILKSKSSHTSLFDRHARDQSQPRAMKAVMSSTSNGTLSPSRRGSTENPDDSRRGRSTQARERPSEDGASTDKEESVHVGLKAFRQARLELQKMKELEAMQRSSDRPPMGPRVGSHDIGGPPPSMFNRKARDESRHGSGSRANSRAGSRAPSERERSGSETSNTGPPPLRPMRLRNGSNAYDDQYTPASPPGSARSASGMRHGPPSARQRPYEAGQPSPMASPIGMGTRSRTGSLLGATASTPNLLSNAAAPPLPPINPRRKNALSRASEDDMSSSRIPGGFPAQNESDDDNDTLAQRRQKLRKATSEGTSLRARNSPSSNGVRPPMPQGNMPGGRFLPGGVI
ncbi:hypothetical protein ACHAQJ_000134 [Trichoderma viride]